MLLKLVAFLLFKQHLNLYKNGLKTDLSISAYSILHP